MKLDFITNKSVRGFTILEFIVAIATMIVLITMAVPAYQLFERDADLNQSVEEIVNILKLAQNRTLASEGASRWGVYFSISTNQYILFKGDDYASRATSSDEIHNLKKSTEIYNIVLGGGQEVVFERITGNAEQSGSIDLRQKSNPAKIKTIYIENSGQFGLTAPSAPPDANREKDSRHIHFDYSRVISTSTEIITLTFTYSGLTTTKDIVVAENFKDGQIYWDGEVKVNNETQELKVHTHRLNNPDTEFCIHRDKRYNNKELTIDIKDSPDPDIGTLVSYTVSGDVSTGTSIYVSNLQTQ